MLSFSQVYFVGFPSSFMVGVDDVTPIANVTLQEENPSIVWDPPVVQRLSPSEIQIISTPRSTNMGANFVKVRPTIGGGSGSLTITITFGDGESDLVYFSTYYLNILS